ncbi:MAG: CPBP family intramembrane metalloprotease [Planctomycetaceae bacterium]|nr:CPBP family intramembrane metalloprotease [Planctomycetaceae bacterium]
MKWSTVRQVLVREVRDQMRDRRTLFMIFVLPLLLYPLLGMSLFQMSQFIHEKPTSVLVLGFKELPDFPKLIRSDEDGTLHFADEYFSNAESVRLLNLTVRENDPQSPEYVPQTEAEAQARQAVQEGEYEAVVYFPPDFNAKLQEFRDELRVADATNGASERSAQSQVPSPMVFYNTAKEKSHLAHDRLNRVLNRWTEAIGLQNLTSRNLPATTARPFSYSDNDIAKKEDREAALWSKILPFLLLIWALTGAFYPAIDLCAGEKERGTLETLLSSPAERSEIVWGKLLTVMLFSVVTAVLNILSIGLTGTLALSGLKFFGPPPPLAPIWLFIALLPMSAMFSALCIALASMARSTKEGQYYLMPLVLVTMPLVILPMAPGVELNLGMSLIPVSGVVVLLKMLLEGHYWDVFRYFLPVAAVTASCCLLAIRWAVDQFNSEGVLFRESERGGLGIWMRHVLRDREGTPSVANAAMCGLLILVTYFFMSFAMQRFAPTTFGEFLRHAIITQVVVILTPTLLMTAICTRSPRQTLLLRAPSWGAVPAAAVLALALHPTALLINYVLQLLYPVNTELLKLSGMLDGGSPWLLAAVLALTPAVCEELAFRGFILSGFRRLGNSWRAIALTSFFFALSHATIMQQAISAGILGLVIGYLAVQTGSILPGMVFHAVHNGAAILLTSWVADTVVTDKYWHWVAEPHPAGFVGIGYHPLIVAGGIVVAGALLRWFSRQPHSLTYEEELQATIRERAERATT